MRPFATAIAVMLVATGCTSVVGLDFDAYCEGAPLDAASTELQCVPRATVRCLCELAEGLQTCSEDGRLSPCECRDASAAPIASGSR